MSDCGSRGQGVQDRAHAQVGLHEGLDLDLARALQHRGVRAHVELDGVPAGPPDFGGRSPSCEL